MLMRAGFKEIILWLLRRRRRFCVTGHSMEPLLKSGEEVFVKMVETKRAKSYDRRILRAGDLVVAKHPQQPGFLLIKQWDGQMLKSWCHEECNVVNGRVLGVVTSIF
ncbi:S26 family signal peptidase [Candidatus Uhrbacteria bacterium]|nr:S26 family signal peptidase [Candidatus Uhrbacteria bacterium]